MKREQNTTNKLATKTQRHNHRQDGVSLRAKLDETQGEGK